MSCNCGSNATKPSIFNAMGIGKRLERKNPLPPGLYWTDLIDVGPITKFAAWVAQHAPFVQILNHEEFPALNWPDCPITEDCGPARAWVKFQVVIDTPWDSTLGFPTVIEPGEIVNSASDTVTDPDFSENCDIACQAKWVVGALAATAMAGVLLARAIR
jgi:hypothetical protein